MLTLLTYPRSILLVVWGILFTVVMSIIVVSLAFVVRSKKILDFVLRYLWSLPLIFPMGIEVEVRGSEFVRTTGKGVLLLFNHSSLIDIPVLYGFFPRPFRFGAKIELFKIPFFGKAMEVCGVLPIDRGNRSKVMKVYEEAIQRIENGESFALAPEGTRQGSAELGKFKRGPFEFAINAKMDVVPVVVAGALNVLPKKSIWLNAGRWSRKIIVQIFPPVSGADYSQENLTEFQELVRSQMAPVFIQLNEELKESNS